jgi:predicted lipoprotein
LAQYNNVIAGSGNAVNGNKNLVIGNYNNVEGNNNWVFVSKFTGKVNGNLLIGTWRI